MYFVTDPSNPPSELPMSRIAGLLKMLYHSISLRQLFLQPLQFISLLKNNSCQHTHTSDGASLQVLPKISSWHLIRASKCSQITLHWLARTVCLQVTPYRFPGHGPLRAVVGTEDGELGTRVHVLRHVAEGEGGTAVLAAYLSPRAHLSMLVQEV